MPASERKPTYSKVMTPTMGFIDAVDMKFKIINEDWNLYELDDGTRIKVKVSVSKISMGIDPKTQGVYLQPTGEPVFGITPTLTVAAEFPKEVLEKLSKK